MTATVVVALSWRLACLRNLPDVGDPFDVAAFRAMEVADADNAFTFYREALKRLVPYQTNWLEADIKAARKSSWVNPSPALRSLVERNREALALWKRGAKQPRSSPGKTSLEELQALNEFRLLALLEAARLRKSGDMAGAWEWYRAILRTGFHIQRREGILARLWGLDHLAFFRTEVATWAKDSRVRTEVFRQALVDVESAESLRVPNSETLRAEYIRVMAKLDDPAYLKTAALTPRSTIHGWNAEAQWHRYLPWYEELRDFVNHEPERSRRLSRLVFTNWLAHADGLHPFRTDLSDAHPDLFMTSPATADFAKIYPSGLHTWLQTSRLWDVGLGMPNYGGRSLYGGNWSEWETARLANVTILIATEMFVRDHGKRPESARDLVGPYLNSLPEGYADAK